MPDLNELLGDLADAVNAAVDEAVEAGVPEHLAIEHLGTLARAWQSNIPALVRD